jgi:hypothetical protein
MVRVETLSLILAHFGVANKSSRTRLNFVPFRKNPGFTRVYPGLVKNKRFALKLKGLAKD